VITSEDTDMRFTKISLIVFLLMGMSSAAVVMPSRCLLAIVKCCNTDGVERGLPLRCFEVNGCPGLYWEGMDVCSVRTVTMAISTLTGNLEIDESSMNELDQNDNNIEPLNIDLRMSRRNPRQRFGGTYRRMRIP